MFGCDSMDRREQRSLYEHVSSSEWLSKWILAQSWKWRTCTDTGHLSVSPGGGYLARWGGGHLGRQNGQEREYFKLKIDAVLSKF